MFRKIVLFAFTASLLVTPAVVAPAQAQSIYQGGSYEPGLVPWRGQTSLGPYGVQGYGNNGYRGGNQRGGYYRGGGNNSYQQSGAYYQQQRQQFRVQSYTVPLSRTCTDWVQYGGVGPKVVLRQHAC